MEFLLNYGQIGLVVFLLVGAMVWMFNRLDKHKEETISKREELVKANDEKLQVLENKIAELDKDLAVNQAKDEQTYQALLQLGEQIKESNAAIHTRLDKIDTDLREIFKNQKS